MPRRVGLTVRLAALALVLLATGIALALPAADTRSADAGERVTLADDDGGRPLFTVPALGPGQQFVRCIQLTYRGTGDAQLRLTGAVGGSGLGDKLRLTVERGSGGGYDSCDGFRGAAIYDGTLAGLPGRPVPAQQAGDGDRTTYRFTVTAAPDLQTELLTASATFTWQATGSSPPPSGDDDDPPATPPASPPAADPASPAATPAPGDAKAEPPAEAADPAADSKKHAKGGGGDPAGDRVRPDAGGHGDASGSSGSKKDSDSGVAEQLRKALAAVAATAAEGAKRAAFPMLLLVLMAAFALAQHRLDSRDPKLALAPVHAEPDLPFDDWHAAPITIGRRSLP